MEKFTVDLDKVLDEFEFNEDRAEQLANVLPKRRPVAQSSQSRRRDLPPPYRRTQFEPISLADADYAAAPTPRNKPVAGVPQPWNVEHTLQQPGSESDSEESEVDSEVPYSVPNNINETKHISFYDNNSFKDEFMEHKPISTAGITLPDQMIDAEWLKTSQDAQKKGFGNTTLTGKLNVSGVFSSLNEYMNAGSSSKVNVKDIKTVSNDLMINKVKNLDKRSMENQQPNTQNISLDVRNLPDVASTSNLPALQDPATNFDLPNNTFDLVTNISNDQDIAYSSVETRPLQVGLSSTRHTDIDNDERSVIKAVEKAEALNNVLNTYEIRSIQNISTHQPSNYDIPKAVGFDVAQKIISDTMSITTRQESMLQSDTMVENLCPVVLNDKQPSLDVEVNHTETFKPKPVVSFSQDDNLSDDALLNYLQDIENEYEESLSNGKAEETLNDTISIPVANIEKLKPSDDKDLTRNLDLFCDGLVNQAVQGNEDIDEKKSAVEGNTECKLMGQAHDKASSFVEGMEQNSKLDSHLNLKESFQDLVEVSPVNSPGEYKSMLSAIQSELCNKGTSVRKTIVTGDGDHRSYESTTTTQPRELITGTKTLSDFSVSSDSPVPNSLTSESAVGPSSIEDSSPETSSECERQGQLCTEDFDSDITSTEDGDDDGRSFVGISADTASALEMQADAKRSSSAIVEVRSPMIQSPRDGNAIHVLGEEERPTRPKYLFLPSKITMSCASAEGEASSDEEAAVETSLVGPAGATPHSSAPSEVTDNIQSLEENQNLINTSGGQQAFDTRAYGDNSTNDNSQVTAEQLDNRANIDLAAADGDANLSSPDYSESSVETLSPVPITLAPDLPSLSSLTNQDRTLGFTSPFWIPDNEATACMLCDVKFTVLRRRHHCRACGKVLCSKCCGLKARLEYMHNAEGRVCQPCHDILLRVLLEEHGEVAGSPTHHATQSRQPHPNNPMDYCSTIPPLQQVAEALHNPVPSVLVPVGVLKRQGSNRPKSEVAKQVMFSDGIRPGGDLTELDGSGEPRLPFRRPGRVAKRVATPPGPQGGGPPRASPLPPLDAKTLSYIPGEKGLPPVATLVKGELKLDDAMDEDTLLNALKSDQDPPVMFAINRNFYVNVKILNLSCCVNRLCWCFSTQGLRCVSQDEIMLVLETLPNELAPPRDVFCYFNTLYQDAVKGSTVSDLGCTLLTGPFLGSSDHGAFVYIRPSFQCLRRFVLPTAPYLVAILVHRSETPWARVFPIRLVLRLGAEFRYYPCSLVSVRHRKSVYQEIGHTIMNLLADFRNLSYTLPSVRGLVIHMEDRQTTILLPKNRYDQVTRALNNSNEHVLALAANLSLTADSHLVCVQSEEDLSYHTQAINIHSKPRRVTGASFVVFNGALKTSTNLTAKSSIVEDGLMVQITPDTMLALRSAMHNMKDWSVGCGPTGATSPDETVSVQWVDDDKNFNVGVCSVIDGRALDGIPSIRVHNGTDYLGRTRLVRWTEVFILQADEGGRTGDPLDVGRLSESIARAVCLALVKLLDLLSQADYTKFAIRASIHPDNVCYEGGSKGETLPPIYMNSLDNELVPVLHTAATANENTSAVLELVFHVLLQ